MFAKFLNFWRCMNFIIAIATIIGSKLLIFESHIFKIDEQKRIFVYLQSDDFISAKMPCFNAFYRCTFQLTYWPCPVKAFGH